MAGHGAGVTEAEVDVLVAVDVGETRARASATKTGKFAGPFFHPVHGDPAEEGFLGAFVERGGFGMGRDEIIFFAERSWWRRARSMVVVGRALPG